MRNIYYHEKAATTASLRCAHGSETRAQQASELPEMTSQGTELTTTDLNYHKYLKIKYSKLTYFLETYDSQYALPHKNNDF